MRHAETVTFGGSGLDRAALHRGDAGWLARARDRGRILPLWQGKPLFGPDGLVDLPAGHPVLRDTGLEVFLGCDEDGTACFAADLARWQPVDAGAAAAGIFDPSRQGHPELPGDHLFEDLRNRMATLSPRAAELAATARALLHWHKSHGFCAACGAASLPARAGWERHCPACGAHHFPRTDPVVICLVTHGNRVLLGRSPGWPEGMYSLLAGFVEPGETLEAATRREVFEESGIRLGEVRYLASQPWPFPASLMLGCRAQALTTEITVDPAELEDALWLSREEMVGVLAGRHPKVKAGRNGAIAHFLLRNWLADRLD